MRNILIAAIALALSVSSALAEQAGQKSGKFESPAVSQPKRAGGGNPCAAYGPGFVRVEGSDTCVKLGGGISVGAGGSLNRGR